MTTEQICTVCGGRWKVQTTTEEEFDTCPACNEFYLRDLIQMHFRREIQRIYKEAASGSPRVH